MQEALRDVATRQPRSEDPLASWYAQGRSDGIGDRLLMFDNTGAPSFELLRFHARWASAPGFERALRQRVERLDQFQHPTFPYVRTVEHLDGGDALALVSTYIPGKRLSEMFHGPRLVGLHPAFATWLIHQLTPALAQLQRQGPGVTHGALAADRVVLTPDGSLVIVEHVLGAALETLRLSSSRLWSNFGIMAQPSDIEPARLDRRTDVVQLALLALSVLLGRRITPAEYPQKLRFLLDEFAETAGRRSPSLVPPLRLWLERALRPGDFAFTCAEDAQDGLLELPDHGAPTAIEHASSFRARGLLAGEKWEGEQRVEGTIMKNAATASDFSTPTAVEQSDYFADHGVDSFAETDPPPPPSSRQMAMWAFAATCAIVAVVEAVVIAMLLSSRFSVSAATATPVLVDSPQAGEMVLVDGREAGLTPLDMKIGPNVHSIRILSRAPLLPAVAEPRPLPVESRPAPVAQIDPKTETALAQAAARQKSGGLRLSSPIELKVLEGERVLGSSADGPIVTTAGVHELDLINAAMGFQSRQRVTITAGQIVSLKITPPDGRLSINAAPWAQVWIDGNAAGETPLANVSAAVGEHGITFRHPQLGERRETVVVRSGALTRVSASLGR